MARRDKQGLADDLFELTARLPWWIGVVLALVSYLALHAVAQKPLPALTQTTQAGNFAVSALWQSLARIGQYVLPFIFLIGAGVSAFKRQQAKRLHESAARREDGMAAMSWPEFETLVGEYFRRLGYTVTQQGGAGADGGVDVLLQKGADRYLVQCKHWRALRVGVQPVRELYGVMAAQRVAGGFLVTSGDFTDEARSFAQGREVQLINGQALQKAIRAQAAAPSMAPAPNGGAPAPAPHTVPSCPSCSAPMVLRQARTGPLAGKSFWGCSAYAQTQCRGIRELG